MNNILKQLEEFKNDNLEINKVKNLISEYIDNKSNDFSILNIINLIMNYVTILETLEETSVKGILNDDRKLNSTLDKLKDTINSLEEVMKDDPSELIENLNKDRKYFEQKVKVLIGYNDEIEALEIVLNKMKYKFRNNPSINVEQFSGTIINKIFKDKDSVVINDKIKTVLKSIPMKMTKNKFYDYIESSLSIYYGGNEVDLDDFLQMIKESFTPEIIDYYGEESPLVLEKIEKVKEKIPNANELTIKRLLKELDSIVEELETILDISNLAVELINSLLVIIYNENISKEHLCLKEPSVGSVFTVLDIISKMDKFKINDSILENLYKLEGTMERYIFEADKGILYIDEIDEKYKDEITKLDLALKFDKLVKMKLLNGNSLYVDLELDIHKQSKIQVDKVQLYNKTKELISFIDESSKNISVDLRRAKMNQLMYLMPVAFKKPKELYDFLYNLLENVSNEYELYYTKEMIKQIL